MHELTSKPTWLDLPTDRHHHLSILALLLLLAGTSGACKPGPTADDAGGAESTTEHETTTGDTSTDTSADEDTSTTGDGDGEPDCQIDECPCAPGDEHVVGLSSGHQDTACARFADGTMICWGDYPAMQLHTSNQWWPYYAYQIDERRCPTLPLRWHPRLTVPGGLLGVSTDPMQILGVGADHQVGAVLSPGLSYFAYELEAGVALATGIEKIQGWPEGSLAPEGAFVEVATAWYADSGRACARTDEGEVCCWGHPESGNVIFGLPEWPTDAFFPDQAPDGACWLQLATPAVGMHVLNWSTCVWDAEGALRCWGHYNEGGILGYGDSDPVGAGLTPAEVPPVPVQGKVVALDPPCAVLDDGRVTCWSWAAQWLGAPLPLPEDVGADQAPVVDVGFHAVGVVVGGGLKSYGPRICAWSADGRGKCWGAGLVPWAPGGTCLHGGGPPCDDLGDDEPIASLPELSFGSPIRQIVNNGATLVLLEDGRVHCWGSLSQCPLEYGGASSEVAAAELPPLNFHCDCAD
jgi:hypothetical protein